MANQFNEKLKAKIESYQKIFFDEAGTLGKLVSDVALWSRTETLAELAGADEFREFVLSIGENLNVNQSIHVLETKNKIGFPSPQWFPVIDARALQAEKAKNLILEKENEALRKELEPFADENNWQHVSISYDPNSNLTAVYYDEERGESVRKTLSALTKKETI